MYRQAAFIFVSAIIISGTQAAGTTCTSSYSCGPNHCCRDSNNHVISTTEGGPFGPYFGQSSSGTCVPGKAQKGEMCDSTCKCDAGLSCYRPMSGICCPPSTCVDAAYAEKQREYWANCFSDPKCALPV